VSNTSQHNQSDIRVENGDHSELNALIAKRQQISDEICELEDDEDDANANNESVRMKLQQLKAER
jgi:Fe-S-cluster formation regulator IscX/YfhJ